MIDHADVMVLPPAKPEPVRAHGNAALPLEQRVPPQNVELEMSVLGGIMLEPQEAYPLAAETLTPDSFYLDGHALIFKLMGELFHRGIPPDAQSIIDELRARDLLARVGGSGVVMGMLNAVPTAANVEYHARKVAEKAHARAIIRGCTKVIEEAYKQELPVAEVQDILERAALQLGAQTGESDSQPISESLHRYWEELSDRDEETARQREAGIARPTIRRGLPYGYADLDAYVTLRPSELNIIAARTGVGKTALALNAAHNLAVDHGIPVALFSLEMGAEQLAERLLCIGTNHVYEGALEGIGTDQLDSPNLDALQWSILTKSYQRLAGAPLYIDDSSLLTIPQMRRKCRMLVARHGVQVIIVDYLQLMGGSTRKGEDNRVQEVSEISRGLKLISRELKVPVIALSQLKRPLGQNPDPEPHLSDLRESGSIEQDADKVMFIWPGAPAPRGSVMRPDSLPLYGIKIAKNRNGPTGMAHLLWFAKITRFLPFTSRS